jgi:hypothetical protein
LYIANARLKPPKFFDRQSITMTAGATDMTRFGIIAFGIAPNSGLTKKQAACAADAAINGALSIFVPGYAATKALASFGGFSFNPVGALTGTSGLFSAGKLGGKLGDGKTGGRKTGGRTELHP